MVVEGVDIGPFGTDSEVCGRILRLSAEPRYIRPCSLPLLRKEKESPARDCELEGSGIGMETTGEITRAKNSVRRPAPEIFKYIAGPADEIKR